MSDCACEDIDPTECVERRIPVYDDLDWAPRRAPGVECGCRCHDEYCPLCGEPDCTGGHEEDDDQ